MKTGRCLATEAKLNPQIRFGDDVISRINYAATDDKLAELRDAIIDFINGLLDKLCGQAGVDAKDVYEMAVVGPSRSGCFV